MKTLGVFINTPKQCINIEKAKKYFKIFLSDYIDEPIEVYYLNTDANAREIAKVFGGVHNIVREKDIINLQDNNLILLYFYFVICFKYEVLSEILCKKYLRKFYINTELNLNDLTKDLYEQ